MRKILFILITALVAFGCSSDKSSVVEETAEVSSTTETTMTATEEEVVEEEVVEEETTSACDSWDADPKVTVGWPGSSGDFSGPSIQETARIGAHDGYDRWVLEFRPGSTPPTGWEIWNEMVQK